MRLDKWLWAARFFKTRGLAQAAVAGGKVRFGGERTKPAKEVAPGNELAIRIGEFEWTVTVVALANKREQARAFVARVRERLPAYSVEDFLRAFRFDRETEDLFRRRARQIGFG